MRGESSEDNQTRVQLVTGSSEKLPETDSISAEACSRQLEVFSESLEKSTWKEINDPTKKWPCPACPSASESYDGLHSLAVHTRGKAFERPHQDFAELLKQKLQRRTSLVLPEEVIDCKLVWRPMVMIRDTISKGDDAKWVDMESQVLIEKFRSFDAVKVKTSYDPKGHCVISLLIFRDSVDGHLGAKRLDYHLLKKGTGREAWLNDSSRYPDHEGRPQQLYGYLANENDLDLFNACSPRTKRVKYEMIGYLEMVMSELDKCSEGSQLLEWSEQEFSMELRCLECLEKQLKLDCDKQRGILDKILMVKGWLKTYHEENLMGLHNRKSEEGKQKERRTGNYVLEELDKVYEQKRDELKRRFLEETYDDPDEELKILKEFKGLLEMLKEFDETLSLLTEVRSRLIIIICELLEINLSKV